MIPSIQKPLNIPKINTTPPERERSSQATSSPSWKVPKPLLTFPLFPSWLPCSTNFSLAVPPSVGCRALGINLPAIPGLGGFPCYVSPAVRSTTAFTCSWWMNEKQLPWDGCHWSEDTGLTGLQEWRWVHLIPPWNTVWTSHRWTSNPGEKLLYPHPPVLLFHWGHLTFSRQPMGWRTPYWTPSRGSSSCCPNGGVSQASILGPCLLGISPTLKFSPAWPRNQFSVARSDRSISPMYLLDISAWWPTAPHSQS